MTDVAGRLAAVRERIADAAVRAGRDSGAVTIVGISKGVDMARIREGVSAGLCDLGENRMQEWLTKVALPGGPARWHYVGRLQTNKVRYLGQGITVLHSLDRPQLVAAIEGRWAAWSAGLGLARSGQRSGEAGSPDAPDAPDAPSCLVQVNIAGEAGKAGIDPGEFDRFLERVAAGGLIRVGGLMTIAPYTDRPETVRPVFAALRCLRDRTRKLFPQLGIEHLSMGMSGDFEVAVEEGATMVRIGTAIFGARR
ncbi:MAG: YggS family pyridoxal phosphate enzyme [Bacillota bacterium]|nr:YggS family pyridoxal phosphate enzyme [Bacillota bacterium]